jgi:hypothetical protein
MAAEAERTSRILRAQGERAARYLQAQGQAKAIEKVFAAIKAGRPTPEVLAYQYLQTLPQLAQGDANKVWMIPSDYGKALEGFARTLGAPGDDGVFRYEPAADDNTERPVLDDDEVSDWFDTSTDPRIAEAVRAAEAVARQEVPGPLGSPPRPKPVEEQATEPEATRQIPSPPRPQAPGATGYQGPLPGQYGGPGPTGPPSGPFPQQGPFGGQR